MPHRTRPLPSSWLTKLAAFLVEFTALLYVTSHLVGSTSNATLTWVAQNTSLIPDAEAAGRISDLVERVGPLCVVIIVAFLLYRFLMVPFVSCLRGTSTSRGSARIHFGRFPWRRLLFMALRPRAMADADSAAVKSFVAGELTRLGASEEAAQAAVKSERLLVSCVSRDSGFEIDRYLTRCAYLAVGTNFVATIPRPSPPSLAIDFSAVLTARGYRFIDSGSSAFDIELPETPSGDTTVSAWFSVDSSVPGPIHGAGSDSKLIIVARHQDARQEGLLLELLLAACRMYSAGISGDFVVESRGYFDEVSSRMASIGFVPPEDFDSPGHRGVSSPSEISEWAVDQVASVLSPFRTPFDTVEVTR